ncbi:hypothetical protein NCAS_0A07350 [Naumovozyma castellii]|uniref:Thioredoxin domain-containing protein n=1 Tax=Naumovozyma castellii TaxID=27288 RepID=G0V745_NAUCA|nr:hypothetical protein NCAS_0A07350 [Naumovozyma castellii CBS 4309]CCC67293.1 hypothetical protein NCAS_0A07350 [Naumovozyma castellii CBS 4309]
MRKSPAQIYKGNTAEGSTSSLNLLPLHYNNQLTNNQTHTHIYTKMVKQITSSAEFDSAIAADKLVVVDFFAVWCGPCKLIAPMVDKFEQQYENAAFYKVDVDELSDVAQKNEISSMPTLLFFKSGKQVAKVVGANPAAIKQTIAANV